MTNQYTNKSNRNILFITTIFFIIFIFILSANMSILIYRMLPLPNIVNTSAVRSTFFVNSLARTPIRPNFFRIPLGIGLACLRKVIPQLDQFFRSRVSRITDLDTEHPQIADMVIPPFNLNERLNDNASPEQINHMRLNLANIFSCIIYLAIFLICLLIISSTLGYGISLIGSSSRSLISTSKKINQEIKEMSKEKRKDDKTGWLN